MIGLAVAEDIAYSAERSNKGLAPVGIHLPAQTVNVDVDDIGIGLDPHAPDLVEDHRPRDDAARISTQIF
jgi:hypothetical protein